MSSIVVWALSLGGCAIAVAILLCFFKPLRQQPRRLMRRSTLWWHAGRAVEIGLTLSGFMRQELTVLRELLEHLASNTILVSFAI